MISILKQSKDETIIKGCDNCLWIVTKDNVKLMQTVRGTSESRAMFETHMSKNQFKEVAAFIDAIDSEDLIEPLLDKDDLTETPYTLPIPQIENQDFEKRKVTRKFEIKKSKLRSAIDKLTGE